MKNFIKFCWYKYIYLRFTKYKDVRHWMKWRLDRKTREELLKQGFNVNKVYGCNIIITDGAIIQSWVDHTRTSKTTAE